MKRELKYPDDLPIVMRDIMEFTEPNTKGRELMIDGQLENWKLGIVKAYWDESYGVEVGKSGRVVWLWNDEWEVIEDSKGEITGVEKDGEKVSFEEGAK
jgi:hypothetical protein